MDRDRFDGAKKWRFSVLLVVHLLRSRNRRKKEGEEEEEEKKEGKRRRRRNGRRQYLKVEEGEVEEIDKTKEEEGTERNLELKGEE